MNIYKRQMKSLGVDLNEYSTILKIPKKITKKIINGNGEVTKDMEINNFLRKSLFDKHQEIEKNKEEKKEEVINLKIKENYENEKIKNLIEKYLDSIEVEWYLNKFDYREYFKKFNVKGWADLKRRYDWDLNVGRITGSTSATTLLRVCTKNFRYAGKDSLYPLIIKLYDCFVNGNIKMEKLISSKSSSQKENLVEWFKDFDLQKFLSIKGISYKEFAKEVGVAPTSVHQIWGKKYTPSYLVLKRIKEFVDSFDNKYETKTVTMEQSKVFNETINDEDIMKLDNNSITIVPLEEIGITPLYSDNEEILRNLLKDRLTEEEKTLIRIFGGQI